MTYDSGRLRTISTAFSACGLAWVPARREETRRRGRCRGIGLGTYVESQSGSPEEEAVAEGDAAWRDRG
jgi:hypothetical protein